MYLDKCLGRFNRWSSKVESYMYLGISDKNSFQKAPKFWLLLRLLLERFSASIGVPPFSEWCHIYVPQWLVSIFLSQISKTLWCHNRIQMTESHRLKLQKWLPSTFIIFSRFCFLFFSVLFCSFLLCFVLFCLFLNKIISRTFKKISGTKQWEKNGRLNSGIQ